MGILEAPAISKSRGVGLDGSYTPERPASFLWDTASWPYTHTLTRLPDGRSIAVLNKRPRDFFDSKSAARTAPTTTYYVNGGSGQTIGGITFGTGADANSGLTAALAKQTIQAALTALIATGSPGKIIVAEGDYNRGKTITSAPTVDVALIAAGRVTAGQWDDLTFTISGTAGTYTASVANAPLVVFPDLRTPDGHYVEGILVGSAALVDSTPGSFFITGSTLSVHHPLSVPCTSTNTRVFRSVSSGLALTTHVNVFIGGIDDASEFHFQGGTNATINANITGGSVPSTEKVLAIEGGSARYCATTGTGRGLSVNGWRGLTVHENFDGSANASDGLNYHNGADPSLFAAARSVQVLEINPVAVNNGRSAQTSCQSSTAHEDVVVATHGGWFERGHGGTVRDINSAQRWATGTLVVNDLGDKMFAGAVAPTAWETDSSAEHWVDGVLLRMPGGTRGFVATSTSKIHKRNCWPTAQRDYAQSGATIDTY